MFKLSLDTQLRGETQSRHEYLKGSLMIFNSPQPDYFRQLWHQSKTFRRLMLLTGVYLVFRLLIQAMVLAQVLFAGPIASETTLISNDLQIYMAAANRVVNGQALYLQEALDKVAVFQYAPSFALVLTPLLPVPFGLLALLHTLLSLSLYLLLYLWWGRIFHRLGLPRANLMLAWTLPVWAIFAPAWGDLSYLNIYIITAFVCTLLIEAVLEERLGWALLWLSLLLPTKPYLAFPLVVPFILGRFRFFFKLTGLAVAVYLIIMGVTMMLIGPAYGWAQHIAYARFLAEMTANFPWRTPESGFLGYNHSILQITFYLMGVTPAVLRGAILVKLGLLLPLALVSLRHILQPARQPGYKAVPLSLDLTLAWYTGVMIWLDIVWEIILGAALLAYLLAMCQPRWAKIVMWGVFLPYALLDMWQVAAFLMFGEAIFAQGLYIWVDPSIYLPMVMIVILTFYALLVWRLWRLPVGAEQRINRQTEFVGQGLPNL
jgi:hypothetical protein